MSNWLRAALNARWRHARGVGQAHGQSDMAMIGGRSCVEEMGTLWLDCSVTLTSKGPRRNASKAD